MDELSDRLSLYRQGMEAMWRKGRLTVQDVRALKVLCEVHQLTPAEHEDIAADVRVGRRELMDEVNQHFDDWLKARRQPPPAGTGALRFATQWAPAWKRRLRQPPPAWQTALAGLAALALVAAAIVIVVAR